MRWVGLVRDTLAMPVLTPATADFLDSAPARVVVEVPVLAPIDACWNLIADQASWVQWFDGMSAVKATPWQWTEPGQKRTVTVNGINVDEVAISIKPKVEYAFTIAKWPLFVATKAAEAIRLEDRTNGGSARTLLTYIGAFEYTAMGERTAKILDKQLSDAWGAAFRQLGEMANRTGAHHG